MASSRQELHALGFTGFVKVSDLRKVGGCDVIPERMGVYVVVRESDGPPAFLSQSSGGFFKGADPTLPLEELRRKWVGGAFVVYIGKAGGGGLGATLRSRLKLYMDFGGGKPVGHRGGRMIWQLADSDELLVAWKPLVGVEPGGVEREMIDGFVGVYGMLPFANRRR